MNKRKNAAARKHRITSQKTKARKKGIDPSADALWKVGTWEERRSRAWRTQRPAGETDAGTVRRGRARA